MAVLLSFVAAIAVGAGAGAIEKAAGAGTPAAFIPPRSRPRVGRPAYACGPGCVNALTLAAGRPPPAGRGGGAPPPRPGRPPPPGGGWGGAAGGSLSEVTGASTRAGPQTCANFSKSFPGRRDAGDLEHRLPDVEPDDRGEQRRVKAVERAAVRAEQAAGVLRPRVALEVALEQVAERRRHGHGGAEDECLHAAEPVGVEAREPHRADREQQPERKALDGLVRRDSLRRAPRP